MNKDLLSFASIRDCLERIYAYTTGGEEAFLASRLIQDGLIRNLEVIGEATKNLSAELREANPAIPWRRIAGMRDGLIHADLKVNLARVRRTVDTDLPLQGWADVGDALTHVKKLISRSRSPAVPSREDRVVECIDRC